uniref:RING-type domain-containing protein n=1 Tax=Rhodosorus marinus TaxID=101924 RepID=A0A7S0G588_9RHOD|mmetsp:Transcript_3950/g.5584  ORF Transcript_3950/g.5584 Transcript_3950/m.5584 type:complete len:331 (+) Transcript_3950:59-1051(+)
MSVETQVAAEGSFSCPICITDYSANEKWCSPEGCSHRLCQDCAEQYFDAAIKDRDVPLRCVIPDCGSTFGCEQVEQVLGKDNLSDYEAILLLNYLESDPNVRFCPVADCPFAVIGTPDDPVIECGVCGGFFCFICKNSWAEGHEHVMVEGVDSVKACPNCSIPIQKVQDNSCNKMVCPQCKCSFCWLCGKKVNEIDHFWTPSGCTYYGKSTQGKRRRCIYGAVYLVSSPVLIGVVAAILGPVVLIQIPYFAVRRAQEKGKSRIQMIGNGLAGAMISPFAAAAAIAVLVPCALGVVYIYVPASFFSRHVLRRFRRRKGRSVADRNRECTEV